MTKKTDSRYIFKMDENDRPIYIRKKVQSCSEFSNTDDFMTKYEESRKLSYGTF